MKKTGKNSKKIFAPQTALSDQSQSLIARTGFNNIVPRKGTETRLLDFLRRHFA